MLPMHNEYNGSVSWQNHRGRGNENTLPLLRRCFPDVFIYLFSNEHLEYFSAKLRWCFQEVFVMVVMTLAESLESIGEQLMMYCQRYWPWRWIKRHLVNFSWCTHNVFSWKNAGKALPKQRRYSPDVVAMLWWTFREASLTFSWGIHAVKIIVGPLYFDISDAVKNILRLRPDASGYLAEAFPTFLWCVIYWTPNFSRSNICKKIGDASWTLQRCITDALKHSKFQCKHVHLIILSICSWCSPDASGKWDQAFIQILLIIYCMYFSLTWPLGTYQKQCWHCRASPGNMHIKCKKKFKNNFEISFCTFNWWYKVVKFIYFFLIKTILRWLYTVVRGCFKTKPAVVCRFLAVLAGSTGFNNS